MEFKVAAVGTRMPAWVADGWNEYARRMPPHLPLTLHAVEAAGKHPPAQAKRAEGERLLAALPPRGYAVALDGRGKPWSTETLAARLERWLETGDPVVLMIGGAEGLDTPVLAHCREHWSLGPLTLPHMLVRVIVAEQLYRAWTVVQGHPYHRG